VTLSYLPDQAHRRRADKVSSVAAFGWINAHVAPDANILSNEDPLVYLYTGRHGMKDILPPVLWYQSDRNAMITWLSRPASFARGHRLDYFEFSPVTSRQGIGPEDAAAIARDVAANQDLAELYRDGQVTIYSLR
jgi:hypothetical protein